jgi:hypothetical protein
VRTGEDTFGFIHLSVMEFLVATQAATRLVQEPRDDDLNDLLARREMTPLMADFLCGVAGRDVALDWARSTLRNQLVSSAEKANGSVGFDPSGTRLATGDDGTVRVWDPATGDLLHQLTGHHGPTRSVGFTPDGTRLATGGVGTVRVRDAATGHLLHQLPGHHGRVRSVGFDSTGTRIVSGSDDGTIRVWDTTTGLPLVTMLALPEEGWATVLPDGSYKLVGEPFGRFWWVIGLHRFELGELDEFSPNVRRRATEEPIPGMTSASRHDICRLW